jgi:hypothetical protein
MCLGGGVLHGVRLTWDCVLTDPNLRLQDAPDL